MYEFSVPSKRELGTWMWLSYFILFFLGKKEKGKKKKKKKIVVFHVENILNFTSFCESLIFHLYKNT